MGCWRLSKKYSVVIIIIIVIVVVAIIIIIIIIIIKKREIRLIANLLHNSCIILLVSRHFS